jgi:transcriptional/translational regulatory protein YebC/TACO1
LKCIPVVEIETSDEDADVNDKIMDALLDLDDVDAVYTQ